MIDHVSLGTHRYAEAVAFYQRALAPLVLALQRDTGQEAAFGTAERWGFYLYPADPALPVTGKGTHLALAALSRDAVHQVHAAALAAGGETIFEPKERPDIAATCFGTMFTDRDGHRIELLTHAA